mgnify:CR=1 FL=1
MVFKIVVNIFGLFVVFELFFVINFVVVVAKFILQLFILHTFVLLALRRHFLSFSLFLFFFFLPNFVLQFFLDFIINFLLFFKFLQFINIHMLLSIFFTVFLHVSDFRSAFEAAFVSGILSLFANRGLGASRLFLFLWLIV